MRSPVGEKGETGWEFGKLQFFDAVNRHWFHAHIFFPRTNLSGNWKLSAKFKRRNQKPQSFRGVSTGFPILSPKNIQTPSRKMFKRASGRC